MPWMFSAALPVFVRDTFWDELLVFSSWLPNAKLVGERLTAGADELPVVKLQVGPVVVYVPLETTAYH